jgi:chromosome segregation ATPase
MRQYLKGKRLISLCKQKGMTMQRVIARLNSDRKKLVDMIHQCDEEIAALDGIVKTLEFHQTSVTRADIYGLIKQQAMILHQRHSILFERTNFQENIDDIDNEIKLCQKQFAVIQRKEMKFTDWMRKGKQVWTMQQESVNEDEKLDLFPWVGK